MVNRYASAHTGTMEAAIDPTVPIHDFDQPPVNEVVVGVQFASPVFSLLDAGLFSAMVADEFPQRQVALPIARAIETFEFPFPLTDQEAALNVTAVAGPGFGRAWLQSEDQTRLLQVQADRLLVNWRARPGADSYPRYPAVRDMFARAYEKLGEFATIHQLGDLLPIQAEVSYFNRILCTTDRFGDLQAIFRNWVDLPANDDAGLPGESETAAYRMTRRILSADGTPVARLHIRLQPAFSPDDNAFFFLLELTVRGAPAGPSLADVLTFHDLCRATIVRTFASLTTDEMHKLWERTA